MNLGELLHSYLRQERRPLIFQAPSGRLVHTEEVPFRLCRDFGFECLGHGLLYREHPFAQWKIDPKVNPMPDAIG